MMSPTQFKESTLSLSGHNQGEITNIGAKAYTRVIEAWGLKNVSAAELLAVSLRTWGRIKAGIWEGAFNQDQLMRLSGLVGLYKALHLYFSDDLADRWVQLPNDGPLFQGKTPAAVMIAGGLPSILAARDYVDAVRGGV